MFLPKIVAFFAEKNGSAFGVESADESAGDESAAAD
jgi:hypothetical protein